jgi:Fe-S cluster assembly protein SufD
MTAVKEKQDLYFAQIAALEKNRASSDPPWLRQIRRSAIDRYAELGFPTTKNEEWKYTSVALIARTPFQPAPSGVASGYESSLQTLEGAVRLVFVNGRYAKQLSSTDALPSGVKVMSLAEALAGDGSALATLEQHLARYAKFEAHTFVALNTAFIEDGVFVEVPKDTRIEQPIHLEFVSAPGGQPSLSHPRSLMVVGRGSQVSFVESYRGPKQVYFTNAVTEVVVGENAKVEYARIEQEGEAAFHVATLLFHQARSSVVHSTSIQFGGSLVREDARTVLDGEGAESTLNGLYVIGGRQHVDNHTTIDHAKPHCGSRELYKGVLEGQATGVFNGKIIVRADAQKTDSKQSNKNLLLSENAVINTKPQLEIYADDVKCTHGATIGQIDQEAVFYLRSRGIGLDEARAMLTQAFANDVIGKIKFEPLRARLSEALIARLASGPKPAAYSQQQREGLAARISKLEER